MAQSQPLIWHSLNTFRKLVCALPHERAVALGGALVLLSDVFPIRKFPRRRNAVRRYWEFPAKGAGDRAWFIRPLWTRSRGIRADAGHGGQDRFADAQQRTRAPFRSGKIRARCDTCHGAYRQLDMPHAGSRIWGWPINSLGADQRDERITELSKSCAAPAVPRRWARRATSNR